MPKKIPPPKPSEDPQPPKPLSRTSSDYILRELSHLGDDIDKKADGTQVENVKEIALEAKSIALSAKNKRYDCIFEDDIQDIKKSYRGQWKIPAGLYVTIFIVAMGAVAQFVSFRDSSALVEKKVQTLTNTINTTRDTVLDMQSASRTAKVADDIKQTKAVRSAVMEAFRAQRTIEKEEEEAAARARRRRAAAARNR